ncbi:hypothetical protein DYB35_005689 [Aphanomyces astaci]|uniref:tRNA-guanine(15) transglycosylase-like domain-containing protein n=1 Tax=Aphanomyces astaci TaxID=112090 RepID=A0A418DTC7_APHAT|nr:hypothetical protein DYB35_005689 [Aphanomyces astaci]
MIILHGINHRYAIGGLAGGEDKTSFWTVVALCAERYHNVAYMLHLMAQVRQAILNDSFPSFVRAFMAEWHQGTPVPAWVHDALNYAARPFRVLGIQQVAVGGLNKDALRNLWVDTLGLTYKSSFRSERENVDEDILEAGRGPFAVEVDIMQPIDAAKAPKVHVPQLNHLGLWIDDLATCVDSLTKKGMRFTPGGIRKGAAGYDVVFIHPKGNDAFPLSGEGVLIELVQAPPHVIAAFDAIKE